MAIDFTGYDQALTNAGIDSEQAGRLLNFARAKGLVPGGSAPTAPSASVLNFRGAGDVQQGNLPLRQSGSMLNFSGAPQPKPEPSSITRGPGISFADQYAAVQEPQPPKLAPPSSTDLPSERTLGAQDSDAGLARSGTNLPLDTSRMMTAASRANGGGGTEPQSLEADYRRLLNQEPTREQFPAQPMGKWKKLLGVAASIAAGLGGGENAAGQTAHRFFGAPQDKADRQYNEAKEAWIDKLSGLMRAANLRHLDTEDRNLRSEIDARNRPGNPKQEKPDALNQQYLEAERNLANAKTPEEKAAAKADLDGIERAATLGQKGNQTRNANPFEAFAYGSVQEKQAAQDFLTFEKKIGSKYEKPGEVEQRYSLYQRDPEAYKAMFGDRGAAQNSANASRMLSYFNRQRQQIENNWELDEKQKADQLAEIDQLSEPYLNAAQPGGTNKGGGASGEDRITVISPKGITGTIPRSQLKSAQKRGYQLSK